jgi:hypothetical protein
MQPSRKREGKPAAEGRGDNAGNRPAENRCAARDRACGSRSRLRRDAERSKGGEVDEPLGRSPSGCSRAALNPWRFSCIRGLGGMQPSRKREGKPAAEGRGDNAGNRPVEYRCAARNRARCSRSRLRRDAERSKGGEVDEPLGRSPSGCSRAALNPWRFSCIRGRGGMQPSRRREGKPVVRGRGNTDGNRSLPGASRPSLEALNGGLGAARLK